PPVDAGAAPPPDRRDRGGAHQYDAPTPHRRGGGRREAPVHRCGRPGPSPRPASGGRRRTPYRTARPADAAGRHPAGRRGLPALPEAPVTPMSTRLIHRPARTTRPPAEPAPRTIEAPPNL